MENKITKKVLLQFPKNYAEEPFLYVLIKEYDLVVNIFRAKIDPDDVGYAAVDLIGSDANLKKSLEYLGSSGIIVNERMTGLNWDEEACVSCGACLPHCPTQALHIDDRRSMKVAFDDEKCIECMNCLSHCPYKVCSSIFAT